MMRLSVNKLLASLTLLCQALGESQSGVAVAPVLPLAGGSRLYRQQPVPSGPAYSVQFQGQTSDDYSFHRYAAQALNDLNQPREPRDELAGSVHPAGPKARFPGPVRVIKKFKKKSTTQKCETNSTELDQLRDENKQLGHTVSETAASIDKLQTKVKDFLSEVRATYKLAEEGARTPAKIALDLNRNETLTLIAYMQQVIQQLDGIPPASSASPPAATKTNDDSRWSLKSLERLFSSGGHINSTATTTTTKPITASPTTTQPKQHVSDNSTKHQ